MCETLVNSIIDSQFSILYISCTLLPKGLIVCIPQIMTDDLKVCL